MHEGLRGVWGWAKEWGEVESRKDNEKGGVRIGAGGGVSK